MSKIAIAPMLDWTDRHYRYFMRCLTKETVLYTEMIVADAVIHGNHEHILGFNEIEEPLVIQLGGSDYKKLALASKICAAWGYREINLNVGCPSARVHSGNFGACLMEEPLLVATCIKAMQDATALPITIKHRIGLDYDEDYQKLADFVATIADAGCSHFIVHARNAILTQKLTPKQNREIPPLRYEYVYRLKQNFPQLKFTLNGGVKTVAEINQHLLHVDAVMLGREAYYNPYLFANMDTLYGEGASDPIDNNHTSLSLMQKTITRREITSQMLDYLVLVQQKGIPLHHVTRHMLGLYHGCVLAKVWRHTLSNIIIQSNDINTYIQICKQIPE